MIGPANYILSVLTILGQIAIIGLIIAHLAKKDLPFIKSRVLLLSFLTALGAMLGSLFYSKIVGYEPCVLCWYQRIFMFPQVFILGLALIKKDFSVLVYTRILSAVGLIVSGYQSLLQMNLVPDLGGCNAVGATSCAKIYFLTFGYITLPLMGFTAFLLIFLLSLYNKSTK